MTYQEANALVDDFSFVYKGKSISKETLIECREVIHKALEKQTPKKPKVNYPALFCPCCKSYMIARLDGYFIVETKQKYCHECGQAIDWSDL